MMSHDELTRFLGKTEQSPEIDIKTLPKGGQLIFDDTSISKMYSKNIEGVRFVWCSSLNKAIRGYTLIKIIADIPIRTEGCFINLILH